MQIIRRVPLAAKLGISLATLWRLEKRGDFPPKIHLSANTVGYDLEQIERWLAARTCERN